MKIFVKILAFYDSTSRQLLDTKGDILKDETIATPYSFEMHSCKSDTIDLRYFVNKSDSSVYEKWIKTQKFNPAKIGKYNIIYSHHIYNQSSDVQVKLVDSILLDKNSSAKLFLNGKQVATVPANDLYVYKKEFRRYIDENNICIVYRPKNSNLIRRYLRSILESFNEKR